MSLLGTEFTGRIVEEAKDVREKTGVWIENKEASDILSNGSARIDRAKEKAFVPKILIEQWRKEYNQIRPHSAKNYRPPGLS